MAKLPTHVLNETLVMLVWMHNQGYTTRDIWASSGSRSYRHAGRTNEMIYNLIRNQTAPNYSFTNLIEYIEQAINEQEIMPGSEKTGMLVDMIADILQGAFGRNGLAGNTLEALRKAVLRPEELVALKDAMLKHELACNRCGAAFTNTQLVIYMSGNGEDRQLKQPYMLCSRCAAPTAASCANCGKAVLLSKKDSTFLRKVLCPAHDGKTAPEVVVATETAAFNQDVVLNELRARQREHQAGRGAAIPRDAVPPPMPANVPRPDGIQWHILDDEGAPIPTGGVNQNEVG